MKTNPLSPLKLSSVRLAIQNQDPFAPTFVYPSLSSAHQHTSLSLSLSLAPPLAQLLSLFVNKTPVSVCLSLTVHLAGHIVFSLPSWIQQRTATLSRNMLWKSRTKTEPYCLQVGFSSILLVSTLATKEKFEIYIYFSVKTKFLSTV